MTITEEEFSAVVRGNEKAFEAIFYKYYKTLVSFSMRHGLDQMEAEDIVSEAFNHIWSARNTLSSPAALNNLLYTAVHNRSLNVYRNLVNRHKIIEKIPVEEENNEDIIYIEEEVSRILNDAIQTLPDQCRTVMKYILAGKETQEIAEEMNISLSSVKTYKARSLKILKEHFKDKPFYLWLLIMYMEKLTINRILT